MYNAGNFAGSIPGNFFSGFTNGMFNNPANAGMPYLNQIGNTISPYYQPYIQAGLGAMPQLQSQYGQLVNNPDAEMNKLGEGYKASPGYQWQMNQSMNAINRAAAAGGMLGTPQSQQYAASTANGLANQDYYNYLNHAMGLYGQGLQGMQGMYNTGYGASNELANSLANVLMTQGQMAYAGQAGQNQNEGALFGGMLGGLGSSLGL